MEEYNKLYATLNQLDEVELCRGEVIKQDDEEGSKYKALIQVCICIKFVQVKKREQHSAVHIHFMCSRSMGVRGGRTLLSWTLLNHTLL